MSKSRDFKLGNAGEKRVIETFSEFGFECVKNTDKEKLLDYDIFAKDLLKSVGDFTIEVKNDWYAQKSGNVAIEYFNSNKNTHSGVAATKANIWTHIIGDDIYAVSVKVLTDYVKKYEPYKELFDVGDGNAHIYLYRISDIIEDIFTKIDGLTKRQGRKALRGML